MRSSHSACLRRFSVIFLAAAESPTPLGEEAQEVAETSYFLNPFLYHSDPDCSTIPEECVAEIGPSARRLIYSLIQMDSNPVSSMSDECASGLLGAVAAELLTAVSFTLRTILHRGGGFQSENTLTHTPIPQGEEDVSSLKTRLSI